MAMIPLFKPYISKESLKDISNILDQGCLTEGYYSDKFEESLGEFLSNKNIALTNSGTSALHLAGILCGLKHGDEIITTAMTCMATNEPFFNMGLNLVFADIDITTGNICHKSIRSKITEKTKAIVVVHWAGQPVDLDEIQSIAQEFNLKVIEDAAHAFGSEYNNIKIGSHSDFVCFSFQAIKHLTCGDGGAIACKNEIDAQRARKIRWFGLDRKFNGKSRWDQDITESGYKYHMNNINASIGLNNLKEIDFVIQSHIKNRNYYDENIYNTKIRKMRKLENAISSSWIYSILIDNRSDFIDYMTSNNIECDRVHVRNDAYSVFGGEREDLKNLKEFDLNLVNIPVGWWLSQEDLNYITKIVNKY
jgi:dTDP-4-amino-4,6-dideoxygalactose transaminase